MNHPAVTDDAAELYRVALTARVRVERDAAGAATLTVVERSRAGASPGLDAEALSVVGWVFTAGALGGQGLAAWVAAAFACFWRCVRSRPSASIQ